MIEQNDLYGQNINGIDIPSKENVLFKRLTTILKAIYNGKILIRYNVLNYTKFNYILN